MESENFVAQSPADNLFQPNKCAAAYKENLFRIDLDILLMRMFSASLGWDVATATLKNFQQRLLYTLSRYVSSDADVVCFPADLVDFVDIDDSYLGSLDIVIGILKETQNDVFNVLADVTGFGQSRCISDAKWHIENFCKRTRQQSFSRSSRPYDQDIALLDFDVRVGIHRLIFRTAGLKD